MQKTRLERQARGRNKIEEGTIFSRGIAWCNDRPIEGVK